MAEIGKIASRVFDEIIYPRLGMRRPEVAVGPRHGVDAAIIHLGGRRVMAVTTDPFFVEPDYGWERAGWFAVQIVASDVATSGLAPAFFSVDLNLPPEMSDGELSLLWEAVHSACEQAGMAIVAGHTGRYEGCAYPMLGGATALAVGDDDAYVTPAMARPGDVIIMTKGPAVEATALIAITAQSLLQRELGVEMATRAADLFWKLTIVPDAAAAVSAGVRECGVTSLHDATERGLYGGLVEVARASGNGVVVDQGSISILPEVAAVCSLVKIDPFTASSEGTMILTCRPQAASTVLNRLDASGIPAFRIGELTPAEAGMHVVVDGRTESLREPVSDPFWPAYREARR